MKSQEEWARELAGEVAVPYMPHANYLLPLILGRAEVATLLICPRLSALQQLAVRTLYATGLREEELVALGPDCQSDQGLQILGARPRRVCLDEETARALSQLSGPSLFSTTVDELRDWLLEAARWAGVLERFEGAGRPLLPKALRHAYASHCLENGMDLLTLFYQLGHEFVDTTEMYVLTGVALRGASYARSHPLMAGQKGYAGWSQPELMVREMGEPGDEEEDEDRGLRYARLTLEDMELMLASGRTDLHRLIVRVLYATGIRLAELLGLRYLDLDSQECRLFVRQGKGHKDRYCLLDPKTVDMLLAWRGDGGLSEVIFPLPRPSVQKVLTSLAKRTGLSAKYAALGEKLTPHSMRHTFATHCYNGGIDLFSLKTLLGHAYLHTTLAYLACPPERRQQVYDNSHPLAGGGSAA